ncbi:hypothetical protein BDR05DRAFT_952988 [Suillus weaverae]|nr:hypothetical protein BDR05DRAFT_952988 [Suillus weaverae]
MAKAKSKPANEKVKKPTKMSKRGLKTWDLNSTRADGDTMNLKPPDIEWTKELIFWMLTEITKDEDIKQGLFPVPGSNLRSQGVPKTHWHWTLCKKLFYKHEKYRSQFQILQDKGTPKQKEVWHTKIKNKLKHNVPVGLGNNNTAVDMIAICQSSPDFAADDDICGYESKEWDIERQSLSPGLEMKQSTTKQKAAEKAPQRKKKQKKNEFAESAQAEEVRAEKDMMRAKIKLAKIELEREKLYGQREWRSINESWSLPSGFTSISNTNFQLLLL